MEGRRPTADSRSQFWLMCMRCCVLAGCVDVALFFIFHYLGSPILAWINVFSVPMYAIAWWALKTRRNVLALTLIWIEVLIHATLGSLLIGWEAGFYYYLLMFIPALFAGNRSYRRAALTVVALWLFYIGLAVATHLVEPVQPISENARLALYLFNLTVLFGMSSYLSMYYMMTVRRAHRSLSRMATTDPLTLLYNRGYMVELAGRHIAEREHAGRRLAFLLMDVDHFKQVNDLHGHDCGDRVLSQVGALLREALREGDSVGRWGGEEFLALLPGADTRQATQVAERVRQAVAGYDWSLYGLHAPVTLSIGVSEHQAGEKLSDSLNRADAALYAGKHGGRNRVEVALETEQQSAAGSQAG